MSIYIVDENVRKGKTSINNENTYMYNLEQLGKVRLLKVILKYAKEIMDERKYKKKLQTT